MAIKNFKKISFGGIQETTKVKIVMVDGKTGFKVRFKLPPLVNNFNQADIVDGNKASNSIKI